MITKDKYQFYSRYLIRGMENFEFDTLLLPIVNDIIEEIYIYRKSQEVFVDLKIKKAIKKENWVKECNSIQRECKSLLDKVFYRLYVRDFYLSRIEYVHQKTSYLFAGSNIGFPNVCNRQKSARICCVTPLSTVQIRHGQSTLHTSPLSMDSYI